MKNKINKERQETRDFLYTEKILLKDKIRTNMNIRIINKTNSNQLFPLSFDLEEKDYSKVDWKKMNRRVGMKRDWKDFSDRLHHNIYHLIESSKVIEKTIKDVWYLIDENGEENI